MKSGKGSGDTKCHGEASVEIIAVPNLFEQDIPFDLSLLCPAISWVQLCWCYLEVQRYGQSNGDISVEIMLTKQKAEFPLETLAWRNNSYR